MKNNKEIFSLDKQTGEIINNCLYHNNRMRFKADTPFENKIIPYMIMFFCATVDGVVFYSLFSMISYDSPLMLWIQILALLWGFDVIPIYIGIQYKRLRQRITKDKFVLSIALIVFCLACATNIALRILTIDQISPASATATSYIGTVTQNAAESGIDATSVASTIFGIVAPVLTSLGSFLISSITHNPIATMKQRTAKMKEDTRDQVRRLAAILDDYGAEADFKENLESEDGAKYLGIEAMYKAKVLSDITYVKQRLKEHIATAKSNNVLSEPDCEAILARLEEEERLLFMQDAPNTEDAAVSAADGFKAEEAKYTTEIRANIATAS